MTEENRPAVPQDRIRIQYREPLGVGGDGSGRIAIDAPGFPPFEYSIDARTHEVTRLGRIPEGMRVMRPGDLDATNGVVNPYRGEYTLSYVDRTTNTRQFIPLTAQMNEAIRDHGRTPGSAVTGLVGFDRTYMTGPELSPTLSDVLVPLGNHRFQVQDYDRNEHGHFNATIVSPTPLTGVADNNRVPSGGRRNGH